MKKSSIFLMSIVLVALCLPGLALARFGNATMEPYSSPTHMSCSVLAGKVADGGAFAPNPATSKVLSLGTKSAVTYTVNSQDQAVKISCYPTSTGPTNAKTATESRTVTLSNYTSSGGFRTQEATSTTSFGSDLGTFVKIYFDGDSTVTYPITETLFQLR